MGKLNRRKFLALGGVGAAGAAGACGAAEAGRAWAEAAAGMEVSVEAAASRQKAVRALSARVVRLMCCPPGSGLGVNEGGRRCGSGRWSGTAAPSPTPIR